MNKAYNYENVQIGNFLISIGYYLREYNLSLPTSISLLQQTPLDYKIGDMFGMLSGSFFIIEFKREKQNLKSELEKKQRVKLLNYLSLNNPPEKIISRKSHFICYPRFMNKNIDYTLQPYTTIDTPQYPEFEINGVSAFLKALLNTNHIGATFNEIKDYIKLLQNFAGNDASDASGLTSGIFLNFDKNEGIRYIVYDNLDFLTQQIHLKHEINRVIGESQDNTLSRGRRMR